MSALVFVILIAITSTSRNVDGFRSFPTPNVVFLRQHFQAEKRVKNPFLMRVHPDEQARAISEYMVKSHEEKLKAVSDVEKKKAAEIQALKKEIEELKKNSSPSQDEKSLSSIVVSPAEGSKEELAAKLLSYQKFMAEYIVKSQEQKVKAIKAAEEAAEKKFEERLLLLSGSSSGAVPSSALPPADSAETKLYSDRSAKVSAAAEAGKSRWGDEEVKKAGQVATAAPTKKSVAKAIPTPPTASAAAAAAAAAADVIVPAEPLSIPPEVVAADHGLRSQNHVGGLTLAERVALGSSANGVSQDSAGAISKQQAETILFDNRNAKVAAAGSKSRWGEMEVAKAKVAAESTKSLKAPDHGKRLNDAERVNLGAQILQVS